MEKNIIKAIICVAAFCMNSVGMGRLKTKENSTNIDIF